MKSFEEKLAALVSETSVDNWDGEGCRAIPGRDWEAVAKIVKDVRSRMPTIPDPHTSADSGGTIYLRWLLDDRLFDVTWTPAGRVYWVRRIGKIVKSGRSTSSKS